MPESSWIDVALEGARRRRNMVRCFVIAATYKDFDSFCRKVNVNPKASDIIWLSMDCNWGAHLRGVSPKDSVFVFLSGWNRNTQSEFANAILNRVNTITMKSEEPYKRDWIV